MRVFSTILKISVCIGSGVIISKEFQSSLFRRNVDMDNLVPDLEPLFIKNIPLLQCMISCVDLPSCLSVYASELGGTCKGYRFSHRHKTGLNFRHVEGEIYYFKGWFSR